MDIFRAIQEGQAVEAQARKLADKPERTADQIAQICWDLGYDERALAEAFVLEVAQRAHREAVRNREHEAAKRPPRAPGRAPRATPTPEPIQTREEWEAEYYSSPEYLAQKEESDRQWEEGQQRIKDMIQDSVTQRAQEMFAEWTAELLSSTFALADGTRVAWAEATAQQHRDRIEMLNRQAAGTIETAALHERALRDMGQAGVKRLADLKEK